MLLKTRVTLGVVTVGAAIGAALVPATSAFAAPGVTVTWANQSDGLNLQDGQTATVTGSGFPASTQVFVSECSTNVGNVADCDQTPGDGGVTVAQTDATGAFTAPLVVRTETLGSATCGAGSTCYVGATTNPTAPDATNTGIGTMKFDNLQMTPRTGIKNKTLIHLVGAGYNPNATVYVSECTSAVPADALQNCDINSVDTFTTDANGGFTGDYTKVHIDPQVASGPFPCTPGKTCIVAGSDSIANPGAGHIGGAVVTFAALTKTVTTAKSTKASVAKNVKFAVKGKVTAAGNGVSGLKVTLYKVKSSGLTKIASKTTGSTGSYKFAGLTQKKTTKYETKTAASSAKYTAASHSKVVKVTT